MIKFFDQTNKLNFSNDVDLNDRERWMLINEMKNSEKIKPRILILKNIFGYHVNRGFLTNHCNFVILQDCLSDEITLLRVVRQETVICPLLFNL